MKPLIWTAFFLATGLINTACSSVFYHPDRLLYADVSKLPITPQSLTITARDGHQIPAWFFKSPQKKAKALLVQFHGNAQNLSSHFAFLISAPSRGYDHLIFDYRGYGTSEGQPTPQNTVADGQDVLKWARQNHPDTPIVVVAQSIGSAIALKALIDMKNEFKADAIVIDSGFSNYRSVARSILAKSWITWLFQPMGWLIVDNSMAPGDDISQLEPRPFLVVHGTHDPVIDLKHGEKVYQMAPEPKQLWKIQNGGHIDFLYRPAYVEKFYEYLDQIFQ